MSIHLYGRNGRLSLIPDDVADALEIQRRLPRCYRETKICPPSGCDCESQIEEPVRATRTEQQSEGDA